MKTKTTRVKKNDTTTQEVTDVEKTQEELNTQLEYTDKSDVRWNRFCILFITYAFIILMTLILK